MVGLPTENQGPEGHWLTQEQEQHLQRRLGTATPIFNPTTSDNFTLASAAPPFRPPSAARPSLFSASLSSRSSTTTFQSFWTLLCASVAQVLTCLISNHDRLEATRPAADLEALRKLETRTRVLVPLEALGHQSRRQARGPLQPHDPHSFQLLLSIILDFDLRFSGTGFFHLTCPFFLQSCRPPPPVQPGHLLGALDSELYCLLFAARHSLTFNLCRGPSHPATESHLPHPLAPPTCTLPTFSSLAASSPPSSITDILAPHPQPVSPWRRQKWEASHLRR